MRSSWKGLCMLMAMLTLTMLPGIVTEAAVKVKKVKVESNYGSMVHVAKGKKVKLTTTVTVTPNKKANKKVTYTSSNKKIAKVTAAGYVKGVKTGSCKITVTSKKNSKKKATIKVKVVKNVTSVSLDVSNADVYVGEKVKLKATVLPATNSFTKVQWTTSNKKIAKVSSTGKVTGVSAGVATIKATSVEGSGKVAKCKVRVLSEDSINLTGLQVLSNNCIRVTLDRAKTLTPDKIKLEGKKYSQGTYLKQYEISKIRNYDNKTYDLTLEKGQELEETMFLRVTIESLAGNGTKSLETQVSFVNTSTPKTDKWIGVVGDSVDEMVDLSEYCYGNVSYQVEGSVAGVTWKQENNILKFTGAYEETTTGTELIVKATDELGNVISKKISVAVGNDSTIVILAEELLVLTNQQLEKKEFVKAVGGSGKYTWEASKLPEGIIMEETGVISGTPLSKGNYSVEITVKDKEKEECSATITATITVEEPRTIMGVVCNSKNETLAGVEVVCKNISTGAEYTTQTDEKGNYTVLVPEGNYQIHIRFAENADSVYNIVVSTGGRQIDFYLDVEL